MGDYLTCDSLAAYASRSCLELASASSDRIALRVTLESMLVGRTSVPTQPEEYSLAARLFDPGGGCFALTALEALD